MGRYTSGAELRWDATPARQCCNVTLQQRGNDVVSRFARRQRGNAVMRRYNSGAMLHVSVYHRGSACFPSATRFGSARMIVMMCTISRMLRRSTRRRTRLRSTMEAGTKWSLSCDALNNAMLRTVRRRKRQQQQRRVGGAAADVPQMPRLPRGTAAGRGSAGRWGVGRPQARGCAFAASVTSAFVDANTPATCFCAISLNAVP